MYTVLPTSAGRLSYDNEVSGVFLADNNMPDLDLAAQLRHVVHCHLSGTPVQHLITIYSLAVPLRSSQQHHERASRKIEADSHPDHWRIQSWEEHPIEEMVWIG